MLANDLYTYRVTWSKEDAEHVGLCIEFPSLSWLDTSPESSLNGIRQLVSEAVVDLESTGEPLPEPISTRVYSGKFNLRIPPELHRQLVLEAAEAGISLNRLASDRLRLSRG